MLVFMFSIFQMATSNVKPKLKQASTLEQDNLPITRKRRNLENVASSSSLSSNGISLEKMKGIGEKSNNLILDLTSDDDDDDDVDDDTNSCVAFDLDLETESESECANVPSKSKSSKSRTVVPSESDYITEANGQKLERGNRAKHTRGKETKVSSKIELQKKCVRVNKRQRHGSARASAAKPVEPKRIRKSDRNRRNKQFQVVSLNDEDHETPDEDEQGNEEDSDTPSPSPSPSGEKQIFKMLISMEKLVKSIPKVRMMVFLKLRQLIA